MKRALIAAGTVAFIFTAVPQGSLSRAFAADGGQMAAPNDSSSNPAPQQNANGGRPMPRRTGQVIVATTYPGAPPSGQAAQMGGPGGMMGPLMAEMGPEIMQAEMSDPKIRGAIMEIRGRMLEDMGRLLEKRGRELQASQPESGSAQANANNNGNPANENNNNESDDGDGPNQ